VLERRVAELEGGLESLCVSTGQAALNYAVLNLAEMGSNIVSIPQIYGTTHTLFAHILPSQGIGVRFAKTDRADAIEKLIDEKTLAVFCESIGNPAGNICDIEAVAAVARRHGIPLIVDNTVATPILLRPIEYGADIVVHSDQISRRSRHDARRRDRRFRALPVESPCAPVRDVQRA
jgi:O-acetylhomoserine (thiol)-lyase